MSGHKKWIGGQVSKGTCGYCGARDVERVFVRLKEQTNGHSVTIDMKRACLPCAEAPMGQEGKKP